MDLTGNRHPRVYASPAALYELGNIGYLYLLFLKTIYLY